MDRIVYDAYKVNIESIDPSKDLSIKKIYGLDKNQVQQQADGSVSPDKWFSS